MSFDHRILDEWSRSMTLTYLFNSLHLGNSRLGRSRRNRSRSRECLGLRIARHGSRPSRFELF